jgi:hypothetical protein
VPARLLDRGFDEAEALMKPLEEDDPLRRELHAAGQALEQGHLKAGLQMRDALAHRRLGGAERRCGRSEALMARSRLEGQQP